MRSWVNTVLAAILGGGVTAAALMGAGIVDSGDHVTVMEPPIAPKGSPALAASSTHGLSAREIYSRSAPGVVFIRAQSISTNPSPFDVFDRQQASESTGSGFVIDDEGLILTNA